MASTDLDGDADLDLAVLGFYVVYFESAEDLLVIFLNEGPDAGGNGSFTHVSVPLGALSASTEEP